MLLIAKITFAFVILSFAKAYDNEPKCFFPDTNFKGDPLQDPVKVENARQCQTLCKDKAIDGECCQFFSFNHESGYCLLWDNTAGVLSNRIDTSDMNVTFTAGPRSCDECVNVGSINGQTMRDFNAPCSDACQKACQERPGCAFWQFLQTPTTGSNCWLKWPEVTTANPANTNHIYGPRSCVGCFTTGKGYASIGCLAQISDVPSAIACQNKCAFRPDCVSFTYHPRECSCQLNGANAVLDNDPDAISGPKQCRNCDCVRDR